MECSQYELYAELNNYGQLYLYGLVCPKLVLLWSVSIGIYAKRKIHAKLKIYSQLKIYGMMHCAQNNQHGRNWCGWHLQYNMAVLLIFPLLHGNLCLKWNRTFHLMKMATLTDSNYWRVVWKRPERPIMLLFTDRRT